TPDEERAHPAASDDSSRATPDDAEQDEQDEQDAESKPEDPFSAVDRTALEQSLSRALDDPSVAFCRAKELDPLGDAELCSLSKAAVRQRCPGLAQACR